jgi:multidrug efflux pump subunit AcrA (membrane-fusion protein)
MADAVPGNEKVLRSLLLIVLVIGGGSGVAFLLISTGTALPRRDVAALAPMVDSVVVHREDATEWFVGYGSAASDCSAQLAAEVAGTVIERVDDIEEGSVVQAGQVLIRLDSREYDQALKRVQALAAMDKATADELTVEEHSLRELQNTAERELRVAADEKRRVADLFEQNLAAKKEFDFANLAYQQARRILQGYEMEVAKIGPRQERARASMRSRAAESELAQLNIERCEIRAPFSGTIHTLLVDKGDRVGPGSGLMTVIDPVHVEIPVQLPASVYDRVAVGALCELTYESRPDFLWHGKVVRIAPRVDERTRTFSVYLEVDNEAQTHPLVPGTFVNARVRGRKVADRILIPRGAIHNSSVFVATDGIARRRSVSVDRIIGDRAVVGGDIHDGERLIVSHLSQLEDGSEVRLHVSSSASLATPGSLPSEGIGVTP